MSFFQGKCIFQAKFTSTKGNWYSAKDKCDQSKGRLFTLKTNQDISLLKYMANVGYKDPFSFIGLKANISAIFYYR